MSISQVVYFHRSRAPSPTRWAAAIREAGFPVELAPDVDIENTEGFVACSYEGVETGFELYCEDVDASDLDERLREAIRTSEAMLAFVTHSDMRGLATAVVAAAVLCALVDGVYHDEQSDELFTAADAVPAARALLQSIRADL